MKKLIMSLLLGFTCYAHALLGQAPKTPPLNFSGCWDSEWSTCNSNGKIAAGATLSFKQDPHNKLRMYGAWTGTADDAKGYRHSGFLLGTFQFTLTSAKAFNGTYTDINGPCKNSKVTMFWNGKR
ncbi:hypothetical protein [Runella aurantiaca]|uniref:Uncharacterized protein n=1 Tax=Runella aurantiaca TaxID=2282308 RepID=A0A369I505_9BACT|nr:hypothetical protein [Runella aurantiaca]RDB02274.1 hypothetical protein DVG78_29690 [Runella aurantiaca]